MPAFEDICYGFEDSITYSAFSENSVAEIKKVMLCSSSLNSIDASNLYIGSPQAADHLLELWDGLGGLNLLVADCAHAGKYESLEAPNLNLVATSAPLADLHNAIMTNISDYADWHERLSSIPVRDGSTGVFLATAVSMFDEQISIYLLSPTFHVIDFCSVPVSPESMLLNIKGDAPLTAMQTDFLVDSTKEKQSTSYYTEPILVDGALKGHLLVAHDENTFIPKSFITLLTQLVPQHAFQSGHVTTKRTRMLTDLFTDILLFDPKDVSPLYDRLGELPHELRPCIRMLVITHDPQRHSTMNAIDSLMGIFPDCNIAPYDRYIIVLVSGDSFLFRPEYDEKKFEQYLERYDAHAAFTASVRFIRGLRFFFKQTENLLYLLKNSDINGGKRHAFLDDFFEYTRVHSYVSSLKQSKGMNKLVYLFHPFVAELLRYDDINRTDFASFAFAFAKNNGSISQTANNERYHRNTIYNKINRINEIFGVDLNDKAILDELVFANRAMQIANAEGYSNDNFITYNESRFLESK